MKKKTLFLCHAAIIAAMYVVLSFVSAALGLSSGVIQCRISEALCILPIYTPAAIPGVAIGCLLFNLMSACAWQDVLFGTLATLIGALVAYLLRSLPYLAPLPTILSNTFIIPFVIKYAYNVDEALPFLLLTVFLGEVISAGIFGYILMTALKPISRKIFGKDR
jgi:uncharacterized membrane protein